MILSPEQKRGVIVAIVSVPSDIENGKVELLCKQECTMLGFPLQKDDDKKFIGCCEPSEVLSFPSQISVRVVNEEVHTYQRFDPG